MNQRNTRLAKGSLLIESTVALTLLIGIALVTLSGSVDIIKPRNWTIIQNMTDAHMTYEEALAKRVSFESLVTGTSAWHTAQTEAVTVGRTFGGNAVTGTMRRTIEADPNNGDITVNPTQMETYTLYSVLHYQIGGVDYVKSRTIIRSR